MVGTCKRGNESSGTIKCGGVFLTSRYTVSFSRRTLLHGVSQYGQCGLCVGDYARAQLPLRAFELMMHFGVDIFVNK